MTQPLFITSIARSAPHPANQYIQTAGQPRPDRGLQREIIYNTGSYPAAFKLVFDPADPRHTTFPLIVDGRFAFAPGLDNYWVAAFASDGFALFTPSFPVTGNAQGMAIAFTTPNIFYCLDLVVESPFRVSQNWTFELFRASDGLSMAISPPI